MEDNVLWSQGVHINDTLLYVTLYSIIVIYYVLYILQVAEMYRSQVNSVKTVGGATDDVTDDLY